jgi:uncharacterized protein YggU (UPF0235/DUF167 family)
MVQKRKYGGTLKSHRETQSKDAEKQLFVALAKRLRAAKSPAEIEHGKRELRRKVFGS